jgi:hypothetical protein
MPVRILLMSAVLFALGCATTKEHKSENERKPASVVTSSLADVKNFREIFRTKDVLHATVPEEVRKMIFLAENDLSSHSSTRQCREFFFDSKGKVGSLGKLILEYLSKEWEYTINHPEDPSPFFYDNIGDIIQDGRCSQFASFTPEQKILFWTYVMQNLAFKESSCDPNIKPNVSADVPNGPAIGLYQLELRKSLRAWRGAECAIEPQAIKTATGNTNCALKIFKSQLKSNKHNYGRFPIGGGKKTSGSYWYGFNFANKVNQWIDNRTITMCSALAKK